MFRRYRESVYWHWCDACRYWPTSDYQLFSVQPPGGQLCPECLERSNTRSSNGESDCHQETDANSTRQG
jgi:hypothetical protein